MRRKNDTDTFSAQTLAGFCDLLAGRDVRIRLMISTWGYPDVPDRPAGFEGLVRLILEQQVSLASARSVLDRLSRQTGCIRPDRILELAEADLRACGLSAQKVRYITALAMAVHENQLDLEGLAGRPDREIKEALLGITGIGSWTCECYLLLNLRRLDIFPAGDLALRKAMIENGLVRENGTTSEIKKCASVFSPCRSALALLLWHAYKKKRGIVIG